MPPTIAIDPNPYELCFVVIEGEEPEKVDGLVPAAERAMTLWADNCFRNVGVYQSDCDNPHAVLVATFHRQDA